MLTSHPITTTPAFGARHLHRLLRAHGGFTLDHGSGEPLDRGVAVCAEPNQAWSFTFAEWTDEPVTEWIHAQERRLAEGDVHLGGWLQREIGKVWLELVWVLPDRLQPAAMALGRLHGQHAVFDLGRRRLVPIDVAAPVSAAR